MSAFTASEFAVLERFFAGESADAYQIFGCHPMGGGLWRFALYAPHAAEVVLAGDLNGWEHAAMERMDCGVWTLTVPASQGDIYKYLITRPNGRRVWKTDPYARHCETPPANGSRVWDCGGFGWHDKRWLNKRVKQDPIAAPMNIYEVHLGTWRSAAPDYCSMGQALRDYCREMGYTHVELLPITEHPYAPSWGYQVTGYYAPTSRYGTPQDFMNLVDTLHQAGIGVLMDWVPAHFPRDEHGLAWFDGAPLYERDDPRMAAHPQWGTLIFDYEKPEVRSFLKSSVGMFLDLYHIDGIRVDAVSSMLYRGFCRPDGFVPHPLGGDIDLGAVSLLREINDLVRSRGAVSIAEESSAYPGVTAPTADGGLGFTFKWDMGFMHDTLDYMALDPLFRKGSHTKLTFSMMYAFNEHFVLAYSHDEVVHGKKSMLDKMPGSYEEKFANLRLLYGYQFAHPGKKLTFMGSEFGQFIEWSDKRELDWFLMDYPKHVEMQRWTKALNRFYLDHPALWQQDDSWLGFTWLNVDDADRSSIAFLRTARDGARVVCACNFTPNVWELQVALPAPGTLTKALSSDEPCYGGTGMEIPEKIKSKNEPFREFEQSALIPLPPLSCTYYLFKEDAHEHRTGKASAAKRPRKAAKPAAGRGGVLPAE